MIRLRIFLKLAVRLIPISTSSKNAIDSPLRDTHMNIVKQNLLPPYLLTAAGNASTFSTFAMSFLHSFSKAPWNSVFISGLWYAPVLDLKLGSWLELPTTMILAPSIGLAMDGRRFAQAQRSRDI